MDYNHFFNFYGYKTQDGWTGRDTQLKSAGYDESKVENTFGKGWSDDGVYPKNIDKEGEFMSRNEQLADINPNLDINNYELVYGKGFINKTKSTPSCLTFTAGEGGASVGFCCWSEDYEPVDMGKNMQYSIDGGKTWQDYTIGVGEDNLVAIELNEGESVMFRGNNENLAYYIEDESGYIFTKCIIEGSVAASGDVTSLLNGVGGDTPLAEYCYSGMFNSCTGLTTAPSLPVTTLANDCYSSMFSGCTGLTTAPSLPATTLANGCYSSMFSGCTGLTTAPSLPATTLANDCYSDMFSGCTGLTTAPSLPATTLAEYCYSGMFSGCTGLTTAPSLPATTLANDCYSYMFQGCTAITSHDVATLNNSSNTFQNNTSCTSLTIHADTPPTIGRSTISGLKADCIIYVPAASVDAYKAAKYWSERSAYIQAI